VVAQSRNEAWLAKVKEEALAPDLPICDPHHHLWDFRRGAVQERYLLDEIVDDIAGGHNVVSSVFIECGAMFKADGPEPFRCIGETEFVNGIAAMSASSNYGSPTPPGSSARSICALRRGGRCLDAHIAAGGAARGSGAGHSGTKAPTSRTTARTRLRACFARRLRAGFIPAPVS
jgi:hypothetical protein